MGAFPSPRAGYQSAGPAYGESARRRSGILVVLGLVDLQQQLHMGEGIVDLLIDVLLESVKALIHCVEAVIDRFEPIVHRFDEISEPVFRCNLRVDQCDDRKHDCDRNRKDLGIVQGFLLPVDYRLITG